MLLRLTRAGRSLFINKITQSELPVFQPSMDLELRWRIPEGSVFSYCQATGIPAAATGLVASSLSGNIVIEGVSLLAGRISNGAGQAAGALSAAGYAAKSFAVFE